MGDMAKTPLFPFLLLSSFFFNLNPSISKTIRVTGLKFAYKYALITQSALICQNSCKNVVYV